MEIPGSPCLLTGESVQAHNMKDLGKGKRKSAWVLSVYYLLHYLSAFKTLVILLYLVTLWVENSGHGLAKGCFRSSWHQLRPVCGVQMVSRMNWGLPSGSSGKEPSCQCRRHKRRGFNPWVRQIPFKRAWQPTPVFLPGKSHGQRSLASYGP